MSGLHDFMQTNGGTHFIKELARFVGALADRIEAKNKEDECQRKRKSCKIPTTNERKEFKKKTQ